MAYSSPANAITVTDPNGGQWHKNYGPQSPSGYGGSAVSGYEPPPGANNTPDLGSVDCQGTITAKITWSGTAPAPKCVILKETSTVSWAGSSGDCKDGLSGTPTSDGAGGSSTGTRYSVKPVAADGTAECSASPTANGSFPVQEGRGVSATASVKYVVEVYPVTINLTGTSPPPDGSFVLTGQQLTATLNLGGSGATLPTGTHPTWTITSGTGADPAADGAAMCFGNFVRTNTADDTDVTGTVEGINFAVKDLQFYTKKAGEIVIKATATIQLPNSPPTTATVNAESKPVQSKRPTVDHWEIRTGTIDFATPTISGTPVDVLTLKGTGTTDGTAREGQDWYAHVTVPSPFSGGTSAWVQLMKPKRDTTYPAGQTPADPIPHNGDEGLDNDFPYGYFDDANKKENWYHSGDSPFYGLGGNKIEIHDTARTWIMYRPPAVTVQGITQGITWVPLQMYTWSWSATAQLVMLPNSWQITSATPPPPHPVPAESFDHPTWTFKHKNLD